MNKNKRQADTPGRSDAEISTPEIRREEEKPIPVTLEMLEAGHEAANETSGYEWDPAIGNGDVFLTNVYRAMRAAELRKVKIAYSIPEGEELAALLAEERSRKP